MSMFDDMNQMVQEGIVDTIAHELYEQWVVSHLDEGIMWTDYNICLLYGDPELKKKFNQFYNVDPKDELYFEVA
jgi:hypothetical protein